MEQVVEHILSTMRQRLNEQLTLDELAKTANFSKFYFARMFRQVTGVPPRRYLYALRLQEAKRLLVATSSSVAEISYRVGYHSVGTFTTRFKASVGVAPTVYRRHYGDVTSLLSARPPDPTGRYAITGRLEGPEDGPAGQALLGLFPNPIPEGRPARCDVLNSPGEWSLFQVPAGRWYVLGVTLPRCGSVGPGVPSKPALVGICGPIRVGPEAPAPRVTVRLRQPRLVDPPLLAGLGGPPC
jgi:AraC family transcriptional regulator